MGKKENIAEAFRVRLQKAFDAQSLNATNFCKTHKIDRTTFGQLLSSDYHRLPRADTIVQISNALGVSMDWLLGQSEYKSRGAEILDHALTIENTDNDATAEDIWLSWHEDASHQKIFHMPVTFPESLKTDDFFIYEYAPIIGEEQAVREAHKKPPMDVNEYAVCMSAQTLEDFALGRFIYKDMEVEKRVEQLEHMALLLDQNYPKYQMYLYDNRDVMVPSFTVFGTNRVALYINEKYLIYTAPQHIAFFREEFDFLIKCSIIFPHQVSQYVRDLIPLVRK